MPRPEWKTFTATRTGFTAETDYTDRLVFSVCPTSDGFTAAINGGIGQKSKRLDNGLMALRVPAGGANQHHLHLPHPGLRTGFHHISLAALAV